jgi:hypothetical protein
VSVMSARAVVPALIPAVLSANLHHV